MIRLFAVALTVAAAVAMLSENVAHGVATTQSRVPVLAVLTADGRVTVLSTGRADSAKVIASTNVGVVPGPMGPPHRLMARVGDRLAVLSAADRSIVLLRDGAVENRLSLPDSIYPIALTGSHDGGRAFLIGTVRGTRSVLSALDSQGLGDTQALPTRDHRDWIPMAAWQLDADGETIAVSYHGARTSSADVIALAPSPRIACEDAPALQGNGCILGHGLLATVQGGIVLATGTPLLAVSDRRGRLIGVVSTAVYGHAMEIDSWADSRTVAYLGPCGAGGGVAVVTLPELSSLPIWQERPTSLDRIPKIAATVRQAFSAIVDGNAERAPLCGDRVVPLSNGSLAILQNTPTAGGSGPSGTLLIVDHVMARVMQRRIFDVAILDAIEIGS